MTGRGRERGQEMREPHVCIAGEDGAFFQTVSDLLKRTGVLVSVASAEEAERVVQAFAPDVVILDIGAPGGPRCAILEKLVGGTGCSVIVLADHADAGFAAFALQTGAFDYLVKPCDPAVLIARVQDAFAARRRCFPQEKSVADIMISLDEYTCVQAGGTVREGMEKLRVAAENFFFTGTTMESGHRAVLVFDGQEVAGVLTMRNLLQALRPAYMSMHEERLPPELVFSPLFWTGLFSLRIPVLENMYVQDIMNPRPPVVDASASLMHAAYLLCVENRRRVVVKYDGRYIGVVREQELFREISRQMLGSK